MSDIPALRSVTNGKDNPPLRYTLAFLPGEDPEEFSHEVSCMAGALGAEGASEIALVETAVFSFWKARRVNRAQTCATAAVIHRIQDDFDDRNIAAVRPLDWHLAREPHLTVTKLKCTTAGCAYLIEQFTILGEWLTKRCSFEVSQRVYALQLGGHRPSDLFCDPVIMEFNRAYLGGLNVQATITAAIVAKWFEHDRPQGMASAEFEQRLERLVTDLPTREQGHALLKEYVQKAIVRLTERRDQVRIREEFELSLAIGSVQADVTTEGQVRAKYVATSESTFNSAMSTLRLLLKERRKYGAGGTESAKPPTKTRKTRTERP